jgi:hypothetical protein
LKLHCQEIHVQPEDYTAQVKESVYEQNDNAMLGSTMDVHENIILVTIFDGLMFEQYLNHSFHYLQICAPRSAVLGNSTGEPVYRLFGACFVGSSGVNGTFKKLTHLRGPSKNKYGVYIVEKLKIM